MRIVKIFNTKALALPLVIVFMFSFSLASAEEIIAPDTPVTEPASTAVEPVIEPVTIIEPVTTPAADILVEPAATAPVESSDAGFINPNEPLISATDTTTASSGNGTTAGNTVEIGAGNTALTIEPTENAGNTPLTGKESAAALETPHNVNTSISRRTDLIGPTIMGQWQMSAEKIDGAYSGKDDSTDNRAQLLPSGRYRIDKPFVACVLAADLSGADNIVSLRAKIYYPESVAAAVDEKLKGCGKIKEEIPLARMDSEAASELLCNRIRNGNYNLINWNKSDKGAIFEYEQVCASDGYIATGNAALFCAETALAYDDPAGNYRIETDARNSANADASFFNDLKYLEVTTFENDFADIEYGPVRLKEMKTVSGDTVWGENSKPTVRNTGNTRLVIRVSQDDFGLGKSADGWNIDYQARVGANARYAAYAPGQSASIDDPLGLGETKNIDFGAMIRKFPDNDNSFTGHMTLSAETAVPLACAAK